MILSSEAAATTDPETPANEPLIPRDTDSSNDRVIFLRPMKFLIWALMSFDTKSTLFKIESSLVLRELTSVVN